MPAVMPGYLSQEEVGCILAVNEDITFLCVTGKLTAGHNFFTLIVAVVYVRVALGESGRKTFILVKE